MTTRREELEHSLAAVRQRIAEACARAGREPAGVRLLAVTKTFPASDVELLAELGCTDVGESRDQEARPKKAQVAGALRWHMIGQVQRNKARHVAGWADVVESVDRPELADALADAARRLGRRLEVLVQVSLDLGEAASRGGVPPAGLLALAEHVAELPELTLAGVMAVAPRHGDPGAAFARLQSAHGELLARVPTASVVSAGMSADLEAAIAHGATQVRLGGALLGNRPALK